MKTAVLTGGSGGLGRATIALLKRNGWRTVSIDINPPESEVAAELPDMHVTADVSDSIAVARAFDDIQNVAPCPDALLCFAGVVLDAPVLGIARGGLHPYPEQAWRKTIDVNLTGTFLCAREFVERLIKKRHKGTIVTCSSPAACGAPGQSAYAASKAGVEAFTVSLAREVAPFNIRVCGFRPALTDTPMAQQYPPHVMESLVKKSLLRRFAQAEEVADGIMFLLSNDLISGRIVEFDGGLSL